MKNEKQKMKYKIKPDKKRASQLLTLT